MTETYYTPDALSEMILEAADIWEVIDAFGVRLGPRVASHLENLVLRERIRLPAPFPLPREERKCDA